MGQWMRFATAIETRTGLLVDNREDSGQAEERANDEPKEIIDKKTRVRDKLEYHDDKRASWFCYIQPLCRPYCPVRY